ncbi:MAG: carboxypeptidase-like regulatory domain-containing protein, partial [Candidatus Cryptobacteroides sp.]
MGAQSKKVTIVSPSSTVGQVLKDIETQTGYLFVYNTSDVDVARKVSLNFTDTAVSQVLGDILAGQGLKWNLEGRYIKILKLGSEQNAAGQGTANGPMQIKGKVYGADGEPLIGASLLIKGTNTGVITDMDGSFNMEIPSGEAVLVASYLGYVDKEIETRGKQYFDIVLQEDT